MKKFITKTRVIAKDNDYIKPAAIFEESEDAARLLFNKQIHYRNEFAKENNTGKKFYAVDLYEVGADNNAKH